MMMRAMQTTINDWVPETKSLFETLQKHGLTILSVDNGENETFFDDTTLENFVEETMACDEAYLYVRTPSGQKRTVFLVYGNDPGELVCDYGVCEELDDAVRQHYNNWEGKSQPTLVRA